MLFGLPLPLFESRRKKMMICNFLLSENGNHLVVELSLLLHHEGVHAAGEIDRLEAVGPGGINFGSAYFLT